MQLPAKPLVASRPPVETVVAGIRGALYDTSRSEKGADVVEQLCGQIRNATGGRGGCHDQVGVRGIVGAKSSKSTGRYIINNGGPGPSWVHPFRRVKPMVLALLPTARTGKPQVSADSFLRRKIDPAARGPPNLSCIRALWRLCGRQIEG